MHSCQKDLSESSGASGSHSHFQKRQVTLEQVKYPCKEAIRQNQDVEYSTRPLTWTYKGHGIKIKKLNNYRDALKSKCSAEALLVLDER